MALKINSLILKRRMGKKVFVLAHIEHAKKSVKLFLEWIVVVTARTKAVKRILGHFRLASPLRENAQLGPVIYGISSLCNCWSFMVIGHHRRK